MKIRTIKYCIAQGFKGIIKNSLMSLASIGTIASCLFILGVTYCIVANVDGMLADMDDSLGVTAFINKDISQEEIDSLLARIKSREDVKEAKYVSPEEAWEKFKKEFSEEEELLEGLDQDNPLINSASYEIYLYEAEQQEGFVKYLELQPEIREINYAENAANVLIGFSLLIRYVGLALILILIFIAILLIVNTIKLAVYIRRYEINIMKYIGAKDTFIKLPFIIEGIIMGGIGAALPLAIVYYSYDYITSFIYNEFPFVIDLFRFIEISNIVSILFPLFFTIGIGLGVIGSTISIKKHLKV